MAAGDVCFWCREERFAGNSPNKNSPRNSLAEGERRRAVDVLGNEAFPGVGTGVAMVFNREVHPIPESHGF